MIGRSLPDPYTHRSKLGVSNPYARKLIQPTGCQTEMCGKVYDALLKQIYQSPRSQMKGSQLKNRVDDKLPRFMCRYVSSSIDSQELYALLSQVLFGSQNIARLCMFPEGNHTGMFDQQNN